MNWLIIKNDLKRNKAINSVLLLFMTFSTVLAVLSVIVGVQTFTSISKLYSKAQPPHFLQMHKGVLDESKINNFMANYDGVVYWQTVTMIDIYGDNLKVKGSTKTYDLSDCRLDIGLVKQNESRDLLLDAKHQIVKLQPGEIGIPVLLREMYGMQIGDQVTLTSNNVSKEFIIKEFVLDAQMNSSLVSSTRVLLSDQDFNSLSGVIGEHEYIIEAYFTNAKEATVFKTAYENAGLPQNGQAVTSEIMFILSAFTDMVVVFIMILISFLLIGVAFICVKYTIMTALEEEVGEIGTMKAIGIPYSEIRNLYLRKYRLLAMVGVILGYLIAQLISSSFTKHISTTFGSVELSSMQMFYSIASAGFIFLVIDFYCRKVLRKIRKLTVVDALVTGKGFGNTEGRVKDGLHKNKTFPLEGLIGLWELRYQLKNWTVVFSVVVIATLMMLIPINLSNTFAAPDFITYMGSSLEDILIEVENGATLETKHQEVRQFLKNNATVDQYFEYKRIRIQTIDKDNKLRNIDVDCGINAGNELKYLSGKAPQGNKEIALSYLNANETNKKPGDELIIIENGIQYNFIVSGIYQDVTSGGFTAKSQYSFPNIEANKYSFSVNLKEEIDVVAEADKWATILGTGVTVDPMEEFINQTLGGVENQLLLINLVIVAIAASLVMLITVMFLKLQITRDLPGLAVYRAIGFTELDIRKRYIIKLGIVAITGIVVGLFLTNILGEQIVNLALSVTGLGINRIDLIANPLISYVLCPIFIMGLIIAAALMVLVTMKKNNIMSLINE